MRIDEIIKQGNYNVNEISTRLCAEVIYEQKFEKSIFIEFSKLINECKKNLVAMINLMNY